MEHAWKGTKNSVFLNVENYTDRLSMGAERLDLISLMNSIKPKSNSILIILEKLSLPPRSWEIHGSHEFQSIQVVPKCEPYTSTKYPIY